MNLNDKEIDFIKKNIQDAESILKSGDPNKLIEALHDFSVYTMDEDDEITDIGRVAERIIDKIIYSD